MLSNAHLFKNHRSGEICSKHIIYPHENGRTIKKKVIEVSSEVTFKN